MSNFEKRIVLSAGGTGGHVFPAQALAHELASQGYKVFIFTDDRGHQFKDPAFSIISIPTSQLHGSLRKKIGASLKLISGLGTALYHLRHIKAHGVVGFG